MAALRGPGPSAPPGTLRRAPCEAWSDPAEQPGVPRKACGHPERTAGEEAEDEDSSVSSGRLSGSSGGHASCAPSQGPWKERPPQVLGSRRQLRQSSPRLEQLRAKVRAQAQWRASCASLGPPPPSSASHLYQASVPAPRRKARKLKPPAPASARPGSGTLSAAGRAAQDEAAPGQGREPSRVRQRQAAVPQEETGRTRSSSCRRGKFPETPTPRRAATDKDSELVGVSAWRRGQALARVLLGPPPPLPRLQSQAPPRDPAPATELGNGEKAGAAENSPVRPRTPSPGSVPSDPQAPAHTPSLACCDQPVNIQSAMAVLAELRQQIQAGLELARDHQLRGGRERRTSTLWLRDLAGRRHRGARSAPDVQDTFCKSPWATVEGTRPSLEGTGSCPPGRRCSTLARWASHPQRAWSAQGWAASFGTPGSPSERLTCFPPRPWSASAGQRARAIREDWEAAARGPWNPLERPSPPTRRRWSASFPQRAGAPSCKGRGSLLPPSGAKPTGRRPAQSTPRNAPGEENEARPPAPCPKARGLLGNPCSSESVRELMRRKALATRQRALQEKASAVRAPELRSQRLRELSRKQRGAVPVVSQTTPGIVTFVPHSAQSRDLEAAGTPGSPVLQWSKVTSGVVLGDQEAPGSFCLCLNRALKHAEMLETGGPQEGWAGAPPLMSAGSSLGSPKLQGPATRSPRPGLCVYLDPEEAERPDTPGPLHFRYKHARLQALETMANVLKRRIDILTAQLLGVEAADTLGDPVSDPPPLCPSAMPAAPACPRGLVPTGAGGAPQDWADVPAGTLLSPTCLLDSGTPLWSPNLEARRSAGSRGHLASRPRGLVDDGRSELDKRLARYAASSPACSPFAGSSHGVPAPPDPTCGSLWLEETPTAGGAGLLTPGTARSCGGREPGGLRSGQLANVQQKSLSFLQSLKLDQQKQGQALALLRQRAETEVWETQKALDQVLFRHQLQRLVDKHAARAELRRLQVRGNLDPKTSRSTGTARARSHPPLDTDAAAPSQGPEEGRAGLASPGSPLQRPPGSASVSPPYTAARSPSRGEPMQEGRPHQGPSQLARARFHPWDHLTHQMLKRSPRKEELRARLLHLREKALEEKTRMELVWLEHQRGYLDRKGNCAVLMALVKQQQQVLSDLEQEQRDVRYLWNSHLLLQHHRDTLSVQRSLARLQQQLQAPPPLPQSPGPEVKATQEGSSEASQRPEGPALGSLCPPTPLRPGSPSSHCTWRSPKSPRVPQPLSEQQDGTSCRTASAPDSRLQPPRPVRMGATATADSWPDAHGRLEDSGSHVGLGEPQANASPSTAEQPGALTESGAHGVQGLSQHARGGGAPCGPREASVLEGGTGRAGTGSGLGSAGSPAGKPLDTESRTGTCWQEDARNPVSWPEAPQAMAAQTACPAPPAAEEAAPPPQRQASPRPRLTASLAPGSPAESAAGTCPGSPVRSCTPSSGGSLSCPSLQEFQKVSAVLVRLSESSGSLSDWEAGGPPDADPIWSREPSPGHAWGLQPGRGWAAWEGPGGSGARPPLGFSPVSGGPESAPGLLDVPTPRSGSELSEASGEVWGEEGCSGAGGRPAAGQSSDLENGGTPQTALPSLGPGMGQEASGSSGSLTSGPDTGKAKRTLPEAACTASPPKTSLSSDLDLSLSCPSGSSVAEGVDSSKEGETGPPLASAGCPGGPCDADLSPATDWKPPQALPEPEVPVGSRGPPGDPSGLAALTDKSWAPGHMGSRTPPVPEEARLPLASGALPEILSPVDEVLSYGSADLPSSPHRGAFGPPPPPTLPADRGATPSPLSEDFPSPPKDTMSPGGSLGPPEEDASVGTGEVPSWSEDELPEAPSPGPQESGLCLGEGAQDGSPGDELGKSSAIAGDQAVAGQWSEPGWLGPCRRGGAGDAPVPPPALSRVARVTAEGLPVPWTAGDARLSGPRQGDAAAAVDVGPCTGVPGTDRAAVVDVVSTQLTRRILCDTLAVLSEPAQPGLSTAEELAGATCALGPHAVAAGQSRGRRDS